MDHHLIIIGGGAAGKMPHYPRREQGLKPCLLKKTS